MSDSRSVLLAAAAEEFSRHGLKGTRIQAIVKRAGVNERMIYHHFGSKEGLYRAVLEAERFSVGDAWVPYLEKSAAMEPYDGMRSVLTALFEIMTTRPRLVALLTHEWLGGAPATTSMPTAEQLPVALRALYERGQHDGVFPADRPFEVAYGISVGALVGLTVFLPRFAESVGLGLSLAELREHVTGQLMDGLTRR
jgi:AcrR family transcriptional regulator